MRPVKRIEKPKDAKIKNFDFFMDESIFASFMARKPEDWPKQMWFERLVIFALNTNRIKPRKKKVRTKCQVLLPEETILKLNAKVKEAGFRSIAEMLERCATEADRNKRENYDLHPTCKNS